MRVKEGGEGNSLACGPGIGFLPRCHNINHATALSQL